MIFDECSTPPIFDLARPSLGLVQHAAREDHAQLGLKAVLGVALVACDRLCEGLALKDARGAPKPVIHGTLSPASIVPERDGSVRLRHEAFGKVVRGEFPCAPEALDAVLVRALEADPERRYPDAVAFRAALREVADDYYDPPLDA